MRVFVTVLFAISLVAYGLGLALLASRASTARREFAVLAHMPTYPRPNDPHFKARDEEYREREVARDAADRKASTAIGHIYNIALFGLAFLLCEGIWLLAALAEGGWPARSAVVRASMAGSMVTAACLLLIALVAHLLFGEEGSDPRVYFQLLFVATVGAVLGSAIGVLLGMIRRNREKNGQGADRVQI